MRQNTAPWWRQAEADLDSAEVLLQSGRWYSASWFAQQAAEKALKALHIEQTGQLAPRTHDLEYLGRLVGAPSAIDADLTALNPVFDESRYPDNYGVPPVDAISSSDANPDVDVARRVLTWVRQLL
jgi:HEPN domain-containing protein